MKEKELAKMFNLTLKIREIILFILIVMINRLIYINLDIKLDTYLSGGEERKCQE